MFITLKLSCKTRGAAVQWVYWIVTISTVGIDFCKIGFWLNLEYGLFNSHIRKMLRGGIGIDIGVLGSATIMNELGFVRVWFGDSPKCSNNCGLCLCYYMIATLRKKSTL